MEQRADSERVLRQEDSKTATHTPRRRVAIKCGVRDGDRGVISRNGAALQGGCPITARTVFTKACLSGIAVKQLQNTKYTHISICLSAVTELNCSSLKQVEFPPPHFEDESLFVRNRCKAASKYTHISICLIAFKTT